MSPITSENLKATDLDTQPENLVFEISNPSNGDLALKTDLQKSITNFTQAHINAGDVVFVHRGMVVYILYNKWAKKILLWSPLVFSLSINTFKKLSTIPAF